MARLSVSMRCDAVSTALELLETSGIAYEAQGSGESAFITAVAGYRAADDEFWALYVNGEMATRGAGGQRLSPGDLVEWRVEEIR
ncbi:MAG TPA: DUF4430 domain-containing protein [Cellulomonas sp.]